MRGRPVRTQPIEIDPMFFIPEGVDELKYGIGIIVPESDEIDENEFDVDIDADDTGATDGDDTDYSDAPETPTVFGIIPPQVIHMDASGNEVVDVVFDVEDIWDATSYEIRVTKT